MECALKENVYVIKVLAENYVTRSCAPITAAITVLAIILRGNATALQIIMGQVAQMLTAKITASIMVLVFQEHVFVIKVLVAAIAARKNAFQIA